MSFRDRLGAGVGVDDRLPADPQRAAQRGGIRVGKIDDHAQFLHPPDDLLACRRQSDPGGLADAVPELVVPVPVAGGKEVGQRKRSPHRGGLLEEPAAVDSRFHTASFWG